MAYLQSNIPYFKTWVRREYTCNFQRYHGEFLHAMVIAVTSLPNRSLSFQVIFTGCEVDDTDEEYYREKETANQGNYQEESSSSSSAVKHHLVDEEEGPINPIRINPTNETNFFSGNGIAHGFQMINREQILELEEKGTYENVEVDHQHFEKMKILKILHRI